MKKYVKVDGATPHIPDPVNLRGNYLRKVHDEGVRLLQDVVRSGKYYVAIESDETDDPRANNAFIVTVDVSLIPKVDSESGEHSARKFHIQLQYLQKVDHETLSQAIDKVF